MPTGRIGLVPSFPSDRKEGWYAVWQQVYHKLRETASPPESDPRISRRDYWNRRFSAVPAYVVATETGSVLASVSDQLDGFCGTCGEGGGADTGAR